MSRSGSDFCSAATERSGSGIYPLVGKVTDCHGADTRRYKSHGEVRFDRTAPYKNAPRVFSHSVHIPDNFQALNPNPNPNTNSRGRQEQQPRETGGAGG